MIFPERWPARSGNEAQVLRQRTGDWDLEEQPRAIRIDGQRTAAREEYSNLCLRLDRSGRSCRGSSNVGEKCMRVLGESQAAGKSQIVAEERSSVRQISRSDQRSGCRVGDSLIAARKLNDDLLRRMAGQR